MSCDCGPDRGAPSPHHHVPSVASTLLASRFSRGFASCSAGKSDHSASGVRFLPVSTQPVPRGSSCRAALAIFALALLAVVLGLGCAGESAARKPCPSDAWAGNCKLRDLRKVEERELPMPYVVYEAIYAPQASAQYPQFTPAEVRMRFGTPARSEFALLDHLKPQVLVACRAPATPGSCLAGDLVADVVPFDADHLAATDVPRTTGCAAIDSASEQDRLSKSRSEAAPISERFVFAEGSSALSPDATATASAVARRMAEEPGLECLGLVGQISPGESPSLAEARARSVKQLLISMGVESKRLQTIAATASVFGPGSKALAPEPDSRRVSLSVLLKTGEKTAP